MCTGYKLLPYGYLYVCVCQAAEAVKTFIQSGKKNRIIHKMFRKNKNLKVDLESISSFNQMETSGKTDKKKTR